MQIKLNARLQAAADLVIPGLPCADIGTDHNYLPAYLVQNSICDFVIASDKADHPYQNARQTVADLDLTDHIDIRLGWGLTVLKPGEAQTIVLTGLGANLMQDILAWGAPVLEQTTRLVLQPQRNAEIIRRWLAANGWRIIKETIVKDNDIFYILMAGEKGQMSLSLDEAEFGPYNLANSSNITRAYLQWEQVRIAELMEELEPSQGSKVIARQQQLLSKEARIASILNAIG